MTNSDTILLEQKDNTIMKTFQEIENRLYEINTSIDNKQAALQVCTDSCWYYNSKLNSKIFGSFCKYEKALNSENITIDEAMLILCCLYNNMTYYFYDSKHKIVKKQKQTTLYPVPDRVIVNRSQTSRSKLNTVLTIARKEKLLEYAYIKSENKGFVKINYDIFENDEYIMLKSKSTRFADLSELVRCRREYDTIYFYPYCDRTINKNKNDMIIGITYFYNILAADYIKSEARKYAENKYSVRQDIMYAEVPVHLISKVTGMTEEEIWSKLNRFYKQTKYIAKHDKFYIDTNNISHYYNAAYQYCDLADSKLLNPLIDTDHPIITPYSSIIFINEFKKSKVFKRINKCENYLKRLIIDGIYALRHSKDFSYNDLYTFKLTDNRISSLENKSTKHSSELTNIKSLMSEITLNEGTNVINRHALKCKTTAKSSYRRIYLNLPNINTIPKAVNKFISWVRRLQDDDSRQDIYYYMRNIPVLKERLSELLRNNYNDSEINKIIQKSVAIKNDPDGFFRSCAINFINECI